MPAAWQSQFRGILGSVTRSGNASAAPFAVTLFVGDALRPHSDSCDQAPDPHNAGQRAYTAPLHNAGRLQGGA